MNLARRREDATIAPSFPLSAPLFPAFCPVIPPLCPVIPAKAGIHRVGDAVYAPRIPLDSGLRWARGGTLLSAPVFGLPQIRNGVLEKILAVLEASKPRVATVAEIATHPALAVVVVYDYPCDSDDAPLAAYGASPQRALLRHVSERLFPRPLCHFPAVNVQPALFATGTANRTSGVFGVYAEPVRVFQDEAHVAYFLGMLVARLVNVYPFDRVGGDYVGFALPGQEYLDGILNDVLDDPKRVLGKVAHHRLGFSVGYGESPVAPTNNPV